MIEALPSPKPQTKPSLVSANSSSPMIAVRSLRKKIGQQEILRGVDLEVRAGESVVLIGRSGGTQRNSLISRDGLRQALAEALERNLPYDELALALLSAKGASKPGEQGFNGFVNFLAGSLQENAVQATAKTAAAGR